MKCPVCGESWAIENTVARAENISHLVQNHAWPISHAVAWIQNPDMKLNPIEVRVEIDRLRDEVRKLNARIRWLKKHDKIWNALKNGTVG